MTAPLVAVIHAEARTFHQGRRKRLGQLCDRAANAIAAGASDPALCAEFRSWAIASDKKGRHVLAGKLFAAAKGLE